MSTEPMTASEFVELLEDWNIPYRRIKETWYNHNRNTKGAWGPVNGVMLHHTGSDNQTDMPDILWNGYDDLPGPICHAGIDVNGVVLLSGWGRCNHAGLGDSKILAKVTSEKYTGNLKPTVADTDGNAHFYGFEIMYSGEHVMSVDQQKTATRLSAAICTHQGWTEKSVIGHGEWQPGKWDPGYKKGTIMDMNAARGVVAFEIEKGPYVPTPPVSETYKVVAGDTPWAIAARFLGNGNRWIELVKANPQIAILVPGDVLKLPEK